jgi:hypothetical protein
MSAATPLERTSWHPQPTQQPNRPTARAQLEEVVGRDLAARLISALSSRSPQVRPTAYLRLVK